MKDRVRAASYRTSRRQHQVAPTTSSNVSSNERRDGRPAICRHCRRIHVRHHGRGYCALAGSNHAGDHCTDSRRTTDDLYGGVNGVGTTVDLRGIWRVRDRQYPRADQRPQAQRHRHGRASISRPFRAIRSSALKSPAATAAPCSMATTPSAASSTSSPRPASAARRSRCAPKPASAPSTSAWRSVSTATNAGPWSASFYGNAHQVRRLSGQQRARPAQRDRQPQLHHARSHRIPDAVRRRPEAGIPRRPVRRSVHRTQSNSSPTAGAPARLSTTPTSRAPTPPPASPRRCGTAPNSSSMAACGTRSSSSDSSARRPIPSFASTYVDTRSADLVDNPAIERQKPDLRNALVRSDRHRLLRRDLPLRIAAHSKASRQSTSTICRNRRSPATGSKPSGCCRRPTSPMAPGSRTPA